MRLSARGRTTWNIWNEAKEDDMADSRIWGSGQSRSMHMSPDGVMRRCVSPSNCRYKAASLTFAEKRDKAGEQATLSIAASLFHENLVRLVAEHPRCAAARDLARRRIPVSDPCLGWIPSRKAALKQLEAAGVTTQDMLEAGIADTKRNSTALQFYAHNRLTLAVMDSETGKPTVFYARSYAKTASAPAKVGETAAPLTSGLKYVSSRPPAYALPERDPDTDLYLAPYAKPLFLADRAAEKARETGELYVVEGQFDALACYYGGVENTVCAAGCTDFYQANLDACLALMGGKGKVIISLDNDDAGRAGMLAVARRFPNAAIDVIEPFADGKDPCDYRAEHGDAALREAMSKHRPIMEALVESTPITEVPADLAAVTDLSKRRRLAEHAAAHHADAEWTADRLMARAGKIQPNTVKTEANRYHERRRWVRALGLSAQAHDKGKSFAERAASSEPMQLMVRLAAAADAEGQSLPKAVVAQLPKPLRESGAVERLGLTGYVEEGDTVDGLLTEAKAKFWKNMQCCPCAY